MNDPDLLERNIDAAFTVYDTDADGRISRGEFTAGVAHVFLSSDPAHPGTSILGLA